MSSLYVVDTHALVFYLTNDPRLGKKASKVFDEVEKGKAQILVPIMVLAELSWLIEDKRIGLVMKEIIALIQRNPRYRIVPLDIKILEKYLKLRKVREMHDRMIVATTKAHKATLITRDREILRSGIIEVVW